jgi:phosphatidylglycerol:prolipoprotein diacylglycerol transferase
MPSMLWHTALEMLAYAVGARVYWSAAARQPRPAELGDRLALLAGAICGAFVGSKLLHVAEHLPALLAANQVELWLAGKSLVGGLLGGTLGVELVKKRIGWTRATGDAWVPALAVGIVIGRIGCQLSGLWDLTFGSPTSLPWAWDYGDGIGRHPAAAYEIVLVAALAASALRWQAPPGARFAAFLLGYCAIRFALEFLKPPFGGDAGVLPVALYGGLTAIQWASAMGCAYFAASLRKRLIQPSLAPI